MKQLTRITDEEKERPPTDEELSKYYSHSDMLLGRQLVHSQKEHKAQMAAIERAAMERAKRIMLESIAGEPEYPSDMPDELWAELDGNRENVSQAMRNTVRLTKNNIVDRFLEALKSELGKGDKG